MNIRLKSITITQQYYTVYHLVITVNSCVYPPSSFRKLYWIILNHALQRKYILGIKCTDILNKNLYKT